MKATASSVKSIPVRHGIDELQAHRQLLFIHYDDAGRYPGSQALCLGHRCRRLSDTEQIVRRHTEHITDAQQRTVVRRTLPADVIGDPGLR